MKTPRATLLKRILVVLMVTILLLIPASAASANVRVPFGGTPYYARFDTDTFHTDEWAAIIFYRPPTCIPATFNLLDFFDTGAFECGPDTTTGFEVWKQGPGLEDAPKLLELTGLGAVPVWFVSWPALQAAMQDGVLTIGELSLLPMQRGSASYYHETLRLKSALYGQGVIEARGKLEDGRTFRFHVTFIGPGMNDISIVFE